MPGPSSSPSPWLLSRPGRDLQASDVFVGFFALYVLTASGSAPFGDAVPMWEAAESLVRHGTLAIATRWPVNTPMGRGGHFYPVAALLACLVHVPGALLQMALGAALPGRVEPGVAFMSQLGPLVLGALVPTLFFRLLGRLGYDRRPAAGATLLLGSGTSLWVYAHRPYSEILQAACFLFFLGALIEAGDAPTRRAFRRVGWAAALLVNAKNVYFVCLPGAAVFLGWRLWARSVSDAAASASTASSPSSSALSSWPSPLRRWVIVQAVASAGLGFLPGAVALGVYNHVRWGSFLSSGYGGAVTAGFWRENIFFGLWGQLLSPGKSVFLYSPPLVLALFGVRRLCARRPRVAAAIALTVGPVMLLYARYIFWSGDWAWGPRYLVFALPALLLPVAELLGGGGAPPDAGDAAENPRDATAPDPAANPRDVAAPTRVRRRRLDARAAAVVVAAVAAAGVAVQILGNAFDWSDFTSISIEAEHAWLGRPNVAGTPLHPDPCFSCFENMYPTEWLPVMQPIEGHLWLLKHQLAGDDWRTAEADAPWKRYTSLVLDIQKSYDAAEIDWWLLGPARHGVVPILLITLLLGLAVPIRPWLGALGDAPPARRPSV